MVSKTLRFPKSNLFKRASDLHATLDYWCDHLAGQIEESEDMGLQRVTEKLKDRLHALEAATEEVRRAKIALFDLK
jgi:hypothetical protein